jgi:hypothetical protein
MNGDAEREGRTRLGGNGVIVLVDELLLVYDLRGEGALRLDGDLLRSKLGRQQGCLAVASVGLRGG